MTWRRYDSSSPAVVMLRTSGDGFFVGKISGSFPLEDIDENEKLASTLVAKLCSRGYSITAQSVMAPKPDDTAELIYNLTRPSDGTARPKLHHHNQRGRSPELAPSKLATDVHHNNGAPPADHRAHPADKDKHGKGSHGHSSSHSRSRIKRGGSSDRLRPKVASGSAAVCASATASDQLSLYDPANDAVHSDTQGARKEVKAMINRSESAAEFL